MGTQLTRNGQIAIFEFVWDGDEIKIAPEKHYQLVPPESVTAADLTMYAGRKSESV